MVARLCRRLFYRLWTVIDNVSGHRHPFCYIFCKLTDRWWDDIEDLWDNAENDSRIIDFTPED